jgi:Family of unknown function (DUF5677)
LTNAQKAGADVNLSENVQTLANKIVEAKQDSAHFQAVQAQCAFAVKVNAGILHLVAVRNGASAQALLRTLFETIVSVVILAKHPEKLDDFRNHGKLAAFRTARAIPADSPMAKKLKGFIDATSAEHDALYAYFKAAGWHWHLLTTKDSFTEAGMPEKFWERFYGRASAISHGQPYVVVQHLDMEGKSWEIKPRYTEWDDWADKAHMMGLLLMLHMVESVSNIFSLGLEAELMPLSAQVQAIAQQQMKSAKD